MFDLETYLKKHDVSPKAADALRGMDAWLRGEKSRMVPIMDQCVYAMMAYEEHLRSGVEFEVGKDDAAIWKMGYFRQVMQRVRHEMSSPSPAVNEWLDTYFENIGVSNWYNYKADNCEVVAVMQENGPMAFYPLTYLAALAEEQLQTYGNVEDKKEFKLWLRGTDDIMRILGHALLANEAMARMFAEIMKRLTSCSMHGIERWKTPETPKNACAPRGFARKSRRRKRLTKH